jgi:hypothetical protein
MWAGVALKTPCSSRAFISSTSRVSLALSLFCSSEGIFDSVINIRFKMSQPEKRLTTVLAPSTATSLTQLDDNIKHVEAGEPSSVASTLTQDATKEKTEEQQADLEALEKKETYVSMHSPQSFPDGGVAAWACVSGAFCCLFCSFGRSSAGL